MATLTELIASGAVCRCLRSKTLFYQVEGPVPIPPGRDEGLVPTEVEGEPTGTDGLVPSEAEGPFWCLHTQSLLGPDGKIVELESCRPGRSCCETS